MQFVINGNYIYEKKDITKEWLKKNGFHYNRDYSDSESDIYTIRFPLHKYKNITTLEGELLIDALDGSVNVNAFMPNTNDPYPPFYYIPCGVYDPLMREMSSRIKSQFKKLGITKRRKKNDKSSKI